MGLQRALELWVSVILDYLGGEKNPTFRDFRSAALDADMARWGVNSPEHKTVQDAFAGVNLGPAADRTPPEAKQIRGNLALKATATDPSGVASLSMSTDTNQTATGTPPTVSMALAVSSFAEGTHTASVVAEDNTRNRVKKTYEFFADKTPPTGTIRSHRVPQENLLRTLDCEACADNRGVVRVEYFLDEASGGSGIQAHVGTATSAP